MQHVSMTRFQFAFIFAVDYFWFIRVQFKEKFMEKNPFYHIFIMKDPFYFDNSISI